nr:unnamed protein product [Callosobruchus analis]
MVITREIRDEIRNSVASSISSLLKEDDFLTRIAQKVTEIVAKTIEEKMDKLEKKIVEVLKGEVAVLKSENVRIFNLPEKKNEDLSTEIKRIFLDNLKLKVENHDIEECYRVGRKTDQKTRGVLVRFASLRIKHRKKMLKGTKLVLKEDLTENRLKMMEAAIDKTSLRSVWTHLGNIFVLKEGKKIAIRAEKDVESL